MSDHLQSARTGTLPASWLGRTWLRIKRSVLFFMIRLFRVRDASERVARGFALGLSVNFFPTFGFGVIISAFIARLFGGNVVAGIIGGASVMFFWPALFLLNVKVGALLVSPAVRVDALSDLTERTMSGLVWGQSFMIGAIVNTILFSVTVYVVLLAIHSRFRPLALTYFRSHACNYRKNPMC